MTLANLIVGADAAYLAVDRASYHDDGTILDLKSKWVAREDLRLAMTLSGRTNSDTLPELGLWLAGVADQQQVLAALPGRLAEIERENIAGREAGEDEQCGPIPTFVQAYVALWSFARKQPEAYVCGSSAGTLEGYQPGSVAGVSQVIQPPVPFECPGGRLSLTAARDLIARQRATPDDRGIFRVGGGVDLVEISKNDLSVTEIAAWPADRLGQKVTPARSAGAAHGD